MQLRAVLDPCLLAHPAAVHWPVTRRQSWQTQMQKDSAEVDQKAWLSSRLNLAYTGSSAHTASKRP